MDTLRIATCRPLPEPDPDEHLLLNACHADGIDVQMLAWHEESAWLAELDRSSPILIRSTWDYIHRLDAFQSWLQSMSEHAPIWNPWPVIRENLHKRYLLTLAQAEVPTTPTILVSQGSSVTLVESLAARSWDEVVIKPAVGAGSFATYRLRADDPDAERLWHESVLARDTLIQPYLCAVEDEGERALVWIDGEFTHSVRKSPRFADDSEQVSAALPIGAAERALGEAALKAAIPQSLRSQMLYARVDITRDRQGCLRVMELELIEPSLFLAQHPPALQKLVAALRKRLTDLSLARQHEQR